MSSMLGDQDKGGWEKLDGAPLSFLLRAKLWGCWEKAVGPKVHMAAAS